MGKNSPVANFSAIKLKSIEFTQPFRKLRDTGIEFAPRVTLIAGHNGIGKSTILGLVANTFGLTAQAGEKVVSYFGEPFFANIERIVHLSLTEVAEAKKSPTGAPVVTASCDSVTIKKRCSLTKRGNVARARVVPRTVDRQSDDNVGPDAKVPLPTIYVGIRRLAPVGEASEREVLSQAHTMADEDVDLMVDFIGKVILGSNLTTNVTHHSIKGANKKTLQPGYLAHDSLSISLGQDSIGSIATALASFNRLKREWSNYPGGLLVIDELDIGFHPHAIKRLATELKTQARRLNLQIVATTHSPYLIEAIHPDGEGDPKSPDKVVYLLDTRNPRLAPDQSLKAILDDMALKASSVASSRKPKLVTYFEDEEALQFFKAVFNQSKLRGVAKRLGCTFDYVALGIGGNHLINLPSRDAVFRKRLMVVDGDTTISKASRSAGNIIKLPCVSGSTGTARSPENTIRKFLYDLATADDGPLLQAMRSLAVTNPSSDKIIATFSPGPIPLQREQSKKWWKDHFSTIQEWKIIEAWATVYPAEVSTLHQDFEAAASFLVSGFTSGEPSP